MVVRGDEGRSDGRGELLFEEANAVGKKRGVLVY